MTIVVDDQIQLSEMRNSDKETLLEHLKDREIYERTLAIPFPYTPAHADDWLARVAENSRKHGQPIQWAIRNRDDFLLGALGFDHVIIGESHQAEIGYWLGKSYWSRGIMTAVVRRACEFAFSEWNLVRITAHVFAFNAASGRVLEKCGFEQEGYLKKHCVKDGQFIDAKLYALVR
jgi:ribosomal-protein-alanine N-acetyltransferase